MNKGIKITKKQHINLMICFKGVHYQGYKNLKCLIVNVVDILLCIANYDSYTNLYSLLILQINMLIK